MSTRSGASNQDVLLLFWVMMEVVVVCVHDLGSPVVMVEELSS
jgi:hypothetical protein